MKAPALVRLIGSQLPLSGSPLRCCFSTTNQAQLLSSGSLKQQYHHKTLTDYNQLADGQICTSLLAWSYLKSSQHSKHLGLV